MRVQSAKFLELKGVLSFGSPDLGSLDAPPRDSASWQTAAGFVVYTKNGPCRTAKLFSRRWRPGYRGSLGDLLDAWASI